MTSASTLTQERHDDLVPLLARFEMAGRACLELLEAGEDLAAVEALAGERTRIMEALQHRTAELRALAAAPAGHPGREALEAAERNTTALVAVTQRELDGLREQLHDQFTADRALRGYGQSLPTPSSLPRVVG